MPTWQIDEIQETLRMIESEHLDIRAVTLGVSLRDCASADLVSTCRRVRDKLLRSAERLVATVAQVQSDFAVLIVNKRVSVILCALVAEASGASSYVLLAETLDGAAEALGIDYIAGFSALVDKRM